MAILPNDLTTETIVAAASIQQNDEALENAIEGNLTEANMSASTQLPNAYLANNDFVFTVTLNVQNPAANWIATADAVMTATPMPYDSTEGNATYTILKAVAVWRQVGATIPDFKVDWGYFSAVASGTDGAWNQTTSIVATTALADSNTVTANGCLQSDLTLANSSITTSSTQERMFAIRVSSADDWTAAEGDFLTVTLKLKRELRS
jgi:hypothetical protein